MQTRQRSSGTAENRSGPRSRVTENDDVVPPIVVDQLAARGEQNALALRPAECKAGSRGARSVVARDSEQVTQHDAADTIDTINDGPTLLTAFVASDEDREA